MYTQSSIAACVHGNLKDDRRNVLFVNLELSLIYFSCSRVKLIEKDRECEKLQSSLKSASKSSNGGSSSSSSLKRSGSQDEDLLKKMEVVEKEASILRFVNYT